MAAAAALQAFDAVSELKACARAGVEGIWAMQPRLDSSLASTTQAVDHLVGQLRAVLKDLAQWTERAAETRSAATVEAKPDDAAAAKSEVPAEAKTVAAAAAKLDDTTGALLEKVIRAMLEDAVVEKSAGSAAVKVEHPVKGK